TRILGGGYRGRASGLSLLDHSLVGCLRRTLLPAASPIGWIFFDPPAPVVEALRRNWIAPPIAPYVAAIGSRLRLVSRQENETQKKPKRCSRPLRYVRSGEVSKSMKRLGTFHLEFTLAGQLQEARV